PRRTRREAVPPRGRRSRPAPRRQARSAVPPRSTRTASRRPRAGASLRRTERRRLVDHFLAVRRLGGELVIDGLARRAERRLVRVVHFHPALLQLAEQLFVLLRSG